jgi:F-type H+-transporting ATPase subunit epsilon
MPLKIDIVTAEHAVLSDEVDLVLAPGVEGQLGILPHHAPLMTMLAPGEMVLRKGGDETYLAIAGGFLEVRPDRVVVLADAAERAEEIDLARAEEARRRADERLRSHEAGLDLVRADASLRRALTRLQIAQKRRRRPEGPVSRD